MSDDEAPTSRHTEFSTDAEHNLTCCILMLDILLKQLELQAVEQHMGIHTHVCENVCRLLKCMVSTARVGIGSHVCALKVSECAYCEASIMWHQLSTKLVQYMAPDNPIRPPDVSFLTFVFMLCNKYNKKTDDKYLHIIYGHGQVPPTSHCYI